MSAEPTSKPLYTTGSAYRRRPFAESDPKDKCGDGMWEAYLDAVEDEDKASVESWNGSTTGILTFTGLFAATVAAFVIESYKSLSPDTGAQTVALLAQLVAATNTTPVVPVADIPIGSFVASDTAIIVNSLWFLSLVISLICALLATLIQEWTRDFIRDIHRRTSTTTISQFALNHVYVRTGVDLWGLDKVATVIVALMHMAVGLFLVGLGIFLSSIHYIPARVVFASASVAAAFYVVASVFFFFDNSCPYRTPLAYVFHGFVRWILPCVVIVVIVVFIFLSMCISLCLRIFRIVQAVFGDTFGQSQMVYLDDFYDEMVTWEEGWMLFDVAHYFTSSIVTTRRVPEPKDGDSINAYLSPKHMFSIWKYAGEYILGPNGRPALLDYIPLRLLLLRWRENRPFVHYLFAQLWEKYDVMERMASVQYVSEGMGVLKFMCEAVAVSGEGTLDYRMLHELCYRCFPTLDTLNSTACTEGDLAWLVTLSAFRQTLFIGFQAQSNSVGDEHRRRLISKLEALRGFRLLPLYASDEWLSHIGQSSYEHSGERLRDGNVFARLGAPDMAARNLLTLVAYLVLSPPHNNADHTLISSTWKAFSQESVDNASDFGLYLFEKLDTAIVRRPASSLFVTVLHRAGLCSWLQDPEKTYPIPEFVFQRGGNGTLSFMYESLRLLACRVDFSQGQEPLSDSELAELGLILPRREHFADHLPPRTSAQSLEEPQTVYHNVNSAAVVVDHAEQGHVLGHLPAETPRYLNQGRGAIGEIHTDCEESELLGNPISQRAIGASSITMIADAHSIQSNNATPSNPSAYTSDVGMATVSPSAHSVTAGETEYPNSPGSEKSPGDDPATTTIHSPSDNVSKHYASRRSHGLETDTVSTMENSEAGKESTPLSSPILQEAEEGRIAGASVGQGEDEQAGASGVL